MQAHINNNNLYILFSATTSDEEFLNEVKQRTMSDWEKDEYEKELEFENRKKIK